MGLRDEDMVAGRIDTEDMGEIDMEEMPSSSETSEQVRLARRKAGRAPGLRYWGDALTSLSPHAVCCGGFESGDVDMDLTPESPLTPWLLLATWQVSLTTFMGAERVR